MVHVIQPALGESMSSLGINDCTKSWEAHQQDQQFGENETIDIGKSQRLRKEGNARMNKVSALWPGLAKILEKVHIWRNFESTETDLQIAENACCNDYSDTLSSKWVLGLSKRETTDRSTTYHRCEDIVESSTGVAWASLPITRIHLGAAQESNIQWLLPTLHNSGWMDHLQVRHGGVKAIPVLDPGGVQMAYSYAASLYHSVQGHVRSYGWCYATFL